MDEDTFLQLMQLTYGDHDQRQQAGFRLSRKRVPNKIRLKAKHRGPRARRRLRQLLQDEIAQFNFRQRSRQQYRSGAFNNRASTISNLRRLQRINSDKGYLKSKLSLPFVPDKIRSISIGIGGLGAIGPLFGNVSLMTLTFDPDGVKLGGTIDVGLHKSQFGIAFPITITVSEEKAPKAGEMKNSAFVTMTNPVTKGVTGELTLTMDGNKIGKFLKNPRSVRINDFADASGIEFGAGPGMAGGVSGGVRTEGTIVTIFTFEATSAQRSLGNQQGTAPADKTNVIVDADKYFKNIYK